MYVPPFPCFSPFCACICMISCCSRWCTWLNAGLNELESLPPIEMDATLRRGQRGIWVLMVVAMLYVEKDLSQCVKVAFDKWDTHRDFLNHRYFYVANIRISPRQFSQVIEKGHDPESLYNPPSHACLSFPSPTIPTCSHILINVQPTSPCPYDSQFPTPTPCLLLTLV